MGSSVVACSPSRRPTCGGCCADGADDAAIEAAWRAAMWGKPVGHGINDPELRPAGAADERDRRLR